MIIIIINWWGSVKKKKNKNKYCYWNSCRKWILISQWCPRFCSSSFKLEPFAYMMLWIECHLWLNPASFFVFFFFTKWCNSLEVWHFCLCKVAEETRAIRQTDLHEVPGSTVFSKIIGNQKICGLIYLFYLFGSLSLKDTHFPNVCLSLNQCRYKKLLNLETNVCEIWKDFNSIQVLCCYQC